jgi:uncharacterized membrane protein
VNRKQADIVASGLVVSVILTGVAIFWQRSQQQQDGMMRHMESNTADPLWILGATLVVGIAVGGAYLFVREQIVPAEHTTPPDYAANVTPDDAANAPAAGSENRADRPTEPGEQSPAEQGEGSATSAEETNERSATPTGESNDQAQSGRPLLEMLPEDERTVLEPVIDSPGITQVALRDRSDFSKSKVSQTVSDLEKRGLLYREKQGRTYRVYPTEDVASA